MSLDVMHIKCLEKSLAYCKHCVSVAILIVSKSDVKWPMD